MGKAGIKQALWELDEEPKLRLWLLHVLQLEQHPNFDHIITNWRRWHYEVRR